MMLRETDNLDPWTDDELDMLDSIGQDPILLDAIEEDRSSAISDADATEWSTDEKADIFDCEDLITFIE